MGQIEGPTRAPLLAALLLLAGCIDVDGGAVEAGWDLRIPKNGQRIGCLGDSDTQGAIQRLGLTRLLMELSLAPTGGGADPCAGDARCSFECDTRADQVLFGTTPFFIPEGEYAISTVAVGIDAGGERRELTAADLVSPVAVVRQIQQGQVTDLDVNLIIVQR
jgi:hypothetical protein